MRAGRVILAVVLLALAALAQRFGGGIRHGAGEDRVGSQALDTYGRCTLHSPRDCGLDGECHRRRDGAWCRGGGSSAAGAGRNGDVVLDDGLPRVGRRDHGGAAGRDPH